jgi:hypothetical protein
MPTTTFDHYGQDEAFFLLLAKRSSQRFFHDEGLF